MNLFQRLLKQDKKIEDEIIQLRIHQENISMVLDEKIGARLKFDQGGILSILNSQSLIALELNLEQTENLYKFLHAYFKEDSK